MNEAGSPGSQHPGGPSPADADSYQFQIRDLLLLMAAVAAVCSLAIYFNPAVGVLAGLFVFALWWRRTRWPAVALVLLGGPPLLLLLSSWNPGNYSMISVAPGCRSKLQRIALALRNYADDYGSLPPAHVTDAAGRRTHSWRVLILPYMEERALYEAYRFEEPWDSPNNRRLAARRPDLFACPAAPAAGADTSYLAVVGAETVWPGDRVSDLDDVPDGHGQTILLIEVDGSGIPWMEPRDIDSRDLLLDVSAAPGFSVSSPHRGGALICLADGTVRFLDDDFPPATLRAMLTRNGGEQLAE